MDRSIILKALKTVVASGKTQEEYMKDFLLDFEVVVEGHLEQMSKYLKAIDNEIQEFLEGSETVAAQDPFSEKFEKSIESKIDFWVLIDERISTKFTELAKAYGKHLPLDKILQALPVKIKEPKLEKDIEDHAKEANDYAQSWTETIDNLGMTIQNRMIKNTIVWFATVTKESLIQDYIRHFKEKK
jgi:hypothetical protein